MSSNGIPLNHATLSVTLPGGPYPRKVITRPPGTGGGCIESGPFANYTVHVDGTSTTGLSRASITTFSRPRCITRDFYLAVLAQCSSYEKVSRLILSSTDMTMFHNSVKGVNCGIHATGHVFIGGENMELFSSPNDPMFFLHHANLDRIWTIYQSRDPEKRMYAQAGTRTFMNCKFS
jgi:tyrosinase